MITKESKKLIETSNYINDKCDIKPQIAIVLGSGLGMFSKKISSPKTIPYENIPNFAKSTVEGHAGELLLGNIKNKPVICMKGRFHFYEGYPMHTVVYPIKLFKALGVKTLILTNAAGGINKTFKPGNLMIINDHINYMGVNPLIGPNDDLLGTRFPDMSEVYSNKLILLARKVSLSLNIKLKEGVYLAATGPSYETPSEIKMFRKLGADAVGMSTVPEAIVANYLGLDLFAMSCITNMAAGVTKNKLSHKEVTETANAVKESFIQFLYNFIIKIN